MDSVVYLIKNIKDKTVLYLPYSSIRCLKAFLMGFYYSNQKMSNEFDLLEHEFTKWIHERYKIDNHSWDKTIEFFSHNEFEALDNFFNLFEEFIKSRQSDPDQFVPE
ncbi:hypothetical protein [Tenacibaculum sp. M341]|uniref:hypothetical protein n=1 Tax=Tenacibaculum sp. M341 TaxID=2530339 RepID=UPI00104D8B6E|nr:hypothetical protein [Tenacibaculum sp. M341]TCI93554.1 hypothetical protein EYW44_03865 [Tenacibaculum sp. M341]